METTNNFEKQAVEMVYSVDNYNAYFEAFNLKFAGFGNFEDGNSKVDIIGTLEQNGKYELADFYRELFEMVGIDNYYNSYEPTLESLLKFGNWSIHEFSILNTIFGKNYDGEFKFGFKEFFYNCFDWNNNTFKTSRLKENTGYNEEVGQFFYRWEYMLDGLRFEEELKELIMGIVANVEHSMEIEYSEALYNLEEGNEW